MDNPGGLILTYYATIKGFITKIVTKTKILALVSLLLDSFLELY